MNEVIFNKPDIFQLLREHQEVLVNFGMRQCVLFWFVSD